MGVEVQARGRRGRLATRRERALERGSVVCFVLGLASLAKACTSRSLSTPRERWVAAASAGSLLAGGALTALQFANNRFFDAVNAQIADSGSEPEERVLLTLQHVSRYRHRQFDARRVPSPLFRIVGVVEAASLFHVCARTVLTGGVDHGGPCGALSRALVVLLERAGIQARRAQLCDGADHALHTVVEVRLGERWRVVDPTYAATWRRPEDGELATAEEIAADRSLFERGVQTRSDYPKDLYTYENLQRMNWEKVPGLTRLRDRIRPWIGDDRIRAIPTPYAYERPGYLLSGASFGAAAVSLASLISPRAPL